MRSIKGSEEGGFLPSEAERQIRSFEKRGLVPRLVRLKDPRIVYVSSDLTFERLLGEQAIIPEEVALFEEDI